MRYLSLLAGKLRVFTAVATLALTGCASIPSAPQGQLFERGGVSMVVIPGNSRETYFSDPKSMERHCRAPSPDVSLTASEGVSLNVPSLTGKGGSGVTEDASMGALSLGGRSPAVLISRELLYRACEITNNLNLPPDQALKLFQEVMAAIVKISVVQNSAGTASVAARPVDPRVQVPLPATNPDGGVNPASPTVPNAFPMTVPIPGTGAVPGRW